MNYKVDKNILLLDYLFEVLQNKSKNNIKTILKNGVYVNDKLVTKYDYNLKPGDNVKLILNKIGDIEIIYEDDEFLVLNKPSHLLTIATTKEKEKTLYHIALEYLRKKKQKVFVLHRLDKDTSGIVVFCKNEKLRDILQNNWDKVTRKYVAAINGKLKESVGTYKDYLEENKNHKVYVSKSGNLAVTKYKKIKDIGENTLVDIEILTGRKNQIRVQFAHHGNYILGDSKYSDDDKKYNRLYLHSNKVSFKHPISNKIMEFNAPITNEFKKIKRR